ncbi:MAG: hypothetical protein IKZ68_00580, partial [Bacilli bacterium]|nr:hypothetical protein [Bacilli bacterium]
CTLEVLKYNEVSAADLEGEWESNEDDLDWSLDLRSDRTFEVKAFKRNENMALKQSMPVLICLLVGFLSPIIMTVIYFFVAAFVPPFLYLIILGAILGLLSWLLLRWINTKGAEKFQYLN